MLYIIILLYRSWMKHKLESRLPGETSITAHTQKKKKKKKTQHKSHPIRRLHKPLDQL